MDGRFILDGDRLEHRCQTIGLSEAEIALRASVHGRVGERVICYLDQFGRIEGRIARLFDGGFAVELNAPAPKRERLARLLAWQADRAAGSHPDTRSDERIEPTRKRVVLRLPEGRQVAAQIMDLSRSGATLTCPVPLTLGAFIILGRRPAQVIRAAQRLAGVKFATPIADDAFKTDIIL